MDKDFLNVSGYKDLTAYDAINNIRREEKNKLIADLKKLAEQRGYRIANIIRLEEITD